MTTTGTISASSVSASSVSGGAITATSITSTGTANIGSLVTTGTITATSAVFNVSSSSDAVRITQSGTGQAFVVEDSTNPDASQFVVNNDGNVGIGDSTPSQKLTVTGNIKPSGNVMLSAGQHLALNSASICPTTNDNVLIVFKISLFCNVKLFFEFIFKYTEQMDAEPAVFKRNRRPGKMCCF